MERVRAAVAERIAVVDVDAERLHAAGVDVLADRADHALPFVFFFVAAARRKHDHRRPPMAEDDDAHVTADPIGVPAIIFASHTESWRSQSEADA